jgi:hypothetical protein
MTPISSGEEYNSHGEHVVELPIEATRIRQRRSYAALGVALGLAFVGILVAGTIAHDNTLRAQDEAVQREELRAGWSTLAALASNGAQADETAQAASAAPASATANSQPASVTYQQVVPAAPATVVVVNVPPQSAPTPAATAATVYPMAVPVGVPMSSAPLQSGGVSTFGVPLGPLMDNSSSQISNGGAANASQPQSNGGAPVQSLPNGTVPASPSIPALPNGTVQTAPPSEPPASGVTPLPGQ